MPYYIRVTLKPYDANSDEVITHYSSSELDRAETVTKAVETYLTFGLNRIFGVIISKIFQPY